MTTSNGEGGVNQTLQYARAGTVGAKMPGVVKAMGITSICVGVLGALACLFAFAVATIVFVATTPPPPPPTPPAPAARAPLGVSPYVGDYHRPLGFNGAERLAVRRALSISCGLQRSEDLSADRMLSDYGTILFPGARPISSDAALAQIRSSGRDTGQPRPKRGASNPNEVSFQLASGRLTLQGYEGTFTPNDGSPEVHVLSEAIWRGGEAHRYASSAIEDWMQERIWVLNGRVTPQQASAIVGKLSKVVVASGREGAVHCSLGPVDSGSARYIGQSLVLHLGPEGSASWVLPDGYVVAPSPSLDPQTGLPPLVHPPVQSGPKLPASHAAATMAMLDPIAAFSLAVFLIVAGVQTLRRSPHGDILHVGYLWMKFPAIGVNVVANLWLLWSLNHSPVAPSIRFSTVWVQTIIGFIAQLAYPLVLLALLGAPSARRYFGATAVLIFAFTGAARANEPVPSTLPAVVSAEDERSVRQALSDAGDGWRPLDQVGHRIYNNRPKQIALLKLIADPDVAIRRRAVLAARAAIPIARDGRAPFQAAFDVIAPNLIELLSDPDQQVRFAASELLDVYTTPADCLPKFREALRSASPRSAALIIRAAANCRAPEDQVVEFMDDALAQGRAPSDPLSALDHLHYKGKPAIILGLKSSNVFARQAAARTLRNRPANSDIADALGAVLDDADATVRNEAALGLRHQGERGRQILAQHLDAVNGKAREAALEAALAPPQHPEVLATLLRQAAESDPARRAKAMKTFSTVDDSIRDYRPIVLRTLIDGLADRDADVRGAAAEAIEAINEHSGIRSEESNLSLAELDRVFPAALRLGDPHIRRAAALIGSRGAALREPAAIPKPAPKPLAPAPKSRLAPPDPWGWYVASAVAWLLLGTGVFVGVRHVRRWLAHPRAAAVSETLDPSRIPLATRGV